MQVDGDRFTIEGLVAGDYVVSAATPTNPVAAISVHLEEGATIAIALAAGPTRTVAGRVTRFSDGAPQAGIPCTAATVTGDALPAGIGWNARTTITDATGAFSINGAPAGDALIVCFHHNTSMGATVVTLRLVDGQHPSCCPTVASCWGTSDLVRLRRGSAQ